MRHCDQRTLLSSSGFDKPVQKSSFSAPEWVRGRNHRALRLTAASLPVFRLLHPLALQCQDLTAPNRAQMSCSHPLGTFKYQSACRFSCDGGSLLVGASELRCLATGAWSAPSPKCQGETACRWGLKRLHFRGANGLADRHLKGTGQRVNTSPCNPVILNAGAFRAGRSHEQQDVGQ